MTKYMGRYRSAATA